MKVWQCSAAVPLWQHRVASRDGKTVELLKPTVVVIVHLFFFFFGFALIFSESTNLPEGQRKLANHELSNLAGLTPAPLTGDSGRELLF